MSERFLQFFEEIERTCCYRMEGVFLREKFCGRNVCERNLREKILKTYSTVIV